jgi:transcriptional regulator of acetoin/glycerol metabolism
LLISVTGFFLLTKLKRAHAAQASYALDSNKRFILPESPLNVGTASADSSRNPYATRLHGPQKPLHQHTLQRVREKMKHTGFVSAPEAPQQPDIITEEGVNLRVKEAIARKQAQRYGKIATAQPPVGAKNIQTPLKNATVTGNAFLHAMAQHMDTEGKENIAKAIQQSKPRY